MSDDYDTCRDGHCCCGCSTCCDCGKYIEPAWLFWLKAIAVIAVIGIGVAQCAGALPP